MRYGAEFCLVMLDLMNTAMPPKGAEGNLWIKGLAPHLDIGSARRDCAHVCRWLGAHRDLIVRRREGTGFMGRSDDCFGPSGQWVSPVKPRRPATRER